MNMVNETIIPIIRALYDMPDRMVWPIAMVFVAMIVARVARRP